MKKNGKIQIIYGPMFSGKSKLLIEKIINKKNNNESFLTFKPYFDKRTENIYSRNGKQHKSNVIFKVDEIFNFDLKEIDNIFIDEINFFKESFYEKIIKLKEMGKNIYLSGLDKDYRGDYFPFVKEILEIADEKKSLSGQCFNCGKKAFFTTRKINGKFDKVDSPTYISETLDKKNSIQYFSSCGDCHPLIKKI